MACNCASAASVRMWRVFNRRAVKYAHSAITVMKTVTAMSTIVFIKSVAPSNRPCAGAHNLYLAQIFIRLEPWSHLGLFHTLASLRLLHDPNRIARRVSHQQKSRLDALAHRR